MITKILIAVLFLGTAQALEYQARHALICLGMQAYNGPDNTTTLDDEFPVLYFVGESGDARLTWVKRSEAGSLRYLAEDGSRLEMYPSDKRLMFVLETDVEFTAPFSADRQEQKFEREVSRAVSTAFRDSYLCFTGKSSPTRSVIRPRN